MSIFRHSLCAPGSCPWLKLDRISKRQLGLALIQECVLSHALTHGHDPTYFFLVFD